jgi:hypothetical protein
MTRITQILYNNGTLSPVHCCQAHSDISLVIKYVNEECVGNTRREADSQLKGLQQ